VTEVVGIDLGTTNTVVAAFAAGEARALADETGHTLIPSVVSFHPNGSVLVGRTAKDRRVIDPASTIYSVKRLIGRSWDTEEVRRARSRLPFEMREGPGQSTLVHARGESYTLPEISAFVLRKAKSVAEAALGKPVEQAVITVPANFNDLQRAATKVAGRVAGLEVLRILNEPTAAALAYGYGKDSAERVAVYDFGGGTFDVTLLDLSNNVFEVLATAGNTFLGGDDIDVAIAERMAELFLRQHRYDVRQDPVLFDRFRLAAEQLKQDLSVDEVGRVELDDVMQGDGGKAIDFSFEMRRGELELTIAAIVDQTFDVCRDALSVARLTVTDLDQVLLVGGSTRIPLVRRRVEEFFRREGRHHLSPDEVVAVGAAIQASALASSAERRLPVPPPPVPARRATTEPGGVARGTRPSGLAGPGPAEPGRLRLSSMVDTETPETKPFEPRRAMPTRPGLQPGGAGKPAAAEGKGPSSTLMGLGAKARLKTGAGLGPEPQGATGAAAPPPPPPAGARASRGATTPAFAAGARRGAPSAAPAGSAAASARRGRAARTRRARDARRVVAAAAGGSRRRPDARRTDAGDGGPVHHGTDAVRRASRRPFDVHDRPARLRRRGGPRRAVRSAPSAGVGRRDAAHALGGDGRRLFGSAHPAQQPGAVQQDARVRDGCRSPDDRARACRPG
jgi:molecular chaperone DnaK